MNDHQAGRACGCDPIWNRAVEAADATQRDAMCEAAWERQREHVAARSGFYSRKFAEAGVDLARLPLPELHRLPFTCKAELKQAVEEEPPFGSNACASPGDVKRVYQTSGTTGTPSPIALTQRDEATWTEIGARTYYATGIHDHSSVLSTFGAGPFVAGHTFFVLQRIGARTVPVGPGDTERVLFALQNGFADTLMSTPSFAQYLANRVQQSGQEAPRHLTHVVTGGEPGGGIPGIRDHIESILSVTVTEVMGIGDAAPSLFGECPFQQGMHFCGTGEIWPELVDPDSREPMSIESGAVGELVYTHLSRQAMPVVRFLSGDLVRIEGTDCACGRTSFRMRCIGRRDDMFIVRGVNVYPSAILDILGEFRPRVTGRARIIRPQDAVNVEPPVPVEVEIATSGSVDATVAAEIETAIRARLTFRARVELVPEDAFGEAGYKTALSVRR